MTLSAKDLQIEAEKSEMMKLQLLEVRKERVSSLEPLLQDIYYSRHPKPADYEKRRDLVRCFNSMAKDIFGRSNETPVVVEFGSFVMDLFSTTSDLDLSVNFGTATVPFPRDKKIRTLKKFAKKLFFIQRKGLVSGVLPVYQAKVPIVKCVDNGTGVECDISVENRDGILKSQIIHMISSIDDRFKKLAFLIKNWAKAHNINSSKDRTLNSLSIILLVVFHLQTRNPPILPPFAAIFKDGTDPTTVARSLHKFANYGQRNKESLAELFVSLFIKISSVEKLWLEGLCASVCSASWTSNTWGSKVGNISVEDFTDQSQNVARAVGLDEVKVIYKCIDLSLNHIFSFVDGQIGVHVTELLFGRDHISTFIPRGVPNLPRNAMLPSQSRGTVNEKRNCPVTIGNIVLANKVIPVGRNFVSESVSQYESPLTKRMRTAEHGRANWAPLPAEGQILDSSHQYHQHAEGWSVVSQPRDGGSGVIGKSSSLSCGRMEQPSTSVWRVPEQVNGGGWEGAPQFGCRGWAGEWGRTQQQSAGGWVETRQPGGGGMGRDLQHSHMR